MLLLSLLLAVSARAATFADTPAQMTASVREYFGSSSAEPAGLASALRSLGGIDVKDSRNSLSLENLADETRSAADRLLDQSEQALRPGARPPTDDETARALERIHVLTRTPLRQFLGAHQLQILEVDERRYTDYSSKEAAARVEERLGRMAAALEERRQGPAPLPRPGAALIPSAPSSPQIVAAIKDFFEAPSADLKAFQPALAALHAAQKSGNRDGLDQAAIQEQVRAGADTLAANMRQALETGSDFETAKRLTLRLQLAYFSPMGEFTTREQRTALRQLIEKLGPRYPEGYAAGLRLWNDTMSALNGRGPAPQPSPAAPAAASSSVAARRAERELARYRREARSASRRPAVDKPVTVPDWLRGPAPLSPAMERAHALADALSAAKDKAALLAGAQALADFATTQPKDEDVQRHAARALVETLGHQEDGSAVDQLLARLAAFSQYGRIQEIAVAALRKRGSADALAVIERAATLPHVKALIKKVAAEPSGAQDVPAGGFAVRLESPRPPAAAPPYDVAADLEAALKSAAEKQRLRRQNQARQYVAPKPVVVRREPRPPQDPRPLSPSLRRAHELADALAAANDARTRAAAAQALASFAAEQGEDVETQSHAAHALARALDGGAVDESLARLAAASQFGRVQEIAVSALSERSSAAALAAVGQAATLPHVKISIGKAAVQPSAASSRVAVQGLLDGARAEAAAGRQKRAADRVLRAAAIARSGDAAAREAARVRMLDLLRPGLQSWERTLYYDALTVSIVELEGGRPAEDPALAAWRAQFRADRMKGPAEPAPAPTAWLEPTLRRLKAAASAAAEYWKDIRSFNPGEIE